MVLSVAPRADANLRARSAEALGLLCEWAAEAMAKPLPDTIRRRAALVLIDDLGAAVAVADEPEIRKARAIEIAGARAPEATILAPGLPKVDRIAAGVANGIAATWAELDEGYRLAPCHAGAMIWPALIAEAEASGATIEATLRALAISYEITARFARAFPFATMSVHPHAAYATIGAACGVALLRGLEASALQSALTSAASMTFAGPYGHAIEGALVRNAWSGAAVYIGFRAVDWAGCGIGGLPETGYDVFATCFGTACEPDALSAGLGDHWAIADGYHKVFACCQYAHSMLEAALELHARLGPGAGARVAAIEVETHPRGLTLTAVEPPSVLSAKFSMPHAAAAMACLGTGGSAAFAASTLTDPAIAALRRKVTLKPLATIEPWPNDRAARLTWIMPDGMRHVAECWNARGGADQPFSEAILLAKLEENTRAAFPGMAGRLAELLQPAPEQGAHWRDVIADATGTKAGKSIAI